MVTSHHHITLCFSIMLLYYTSVSWYFDSSHWSPYSVFAVFSHINSFADFFLAHALSLIVLSKYLKLLHVLGPPTFMPANTSTTLKYSILSKFILRSHLSDLFFKKKQQMNHPHPDVNTTFTANFKAHSEALPTLSFQGLILHSSYWIINHIIS